MRPLIFLFWTFGNVCPGFQSQGGSTLQCFVACMHAAQPFPPTMVNSNSRLVQHLLTFLTVCMVAEPFPHASRGCGTGGGSQTCARQYTGLYQLSYWAQQAEDHFATYPIMNPCPSTSCSALRGTTSISVGELSDHRTFSPVRPLIPSSEPRLPDLYCCWSTIAWTDRRENRFQRLFRSVHWVAFIVSLFSYALNSLTSMFSYNE